MQPPTSTHHLIDQHVRMNIFLRLSTAGVLPFLAILVGGWVAAAHGVAPKVFAINAVAATLGLMLAAWWSHRSSRVQVRPSWAAGAVALLLLAATLLFPGLEGVKRWLVVGPLRLNASTAVTPWLLLSVGVFLARARPVLALSVATVTQALHFAQPDAGQAIAFSAGTIALFVATRSVAIGWRLAGVMVTCLGAILTWLRPDPLGAVPHVERILHLASAQGLPWLLAALLAVGCLLIPLVHGSVWLHRARSESAPVATALAVYFVATFAVTELGNFPVPVLGAGAGPVLGWYSALAILRSTEAA